MKRFCYARWKQLFFVFIVLLGVLILEAFVRSPRQRLRPIRTFDTSELYIPKEKTPTAVNSEPIDGKPTTEPIAGKFTTEPIAGKPETSKPKQHYGGECGPLLNKAWISQWISGIYLSKSGSRVKSLAEAAMASPSSY